MAIPHETRQVYPGESFTLYAPGAPWNVYVRTEPEANSIRLVSFSGKRLTVSQGLEPGLQPAADAIKADNGPAFSAESLELLREAGESRRSVQVIFYSDSGSATGIVTLDFGEKSATDIDEAIASDEAFLELLEKARGDAADTRGISVLELPDGRKETYRSVAALDAEIAKIRDRVARYRAYRAGRAFVGVRMR